MEGVIKVEDLTIDIIENLEIRKSIKIESVGAIINDYWLDIPEKLSELLGDFFYDLWNKHYDKTFEFEYNNKKYSFFHGNTKWFSLTRL